MGDLKFQILVHRDLKLILGGSQISDPLGWPLTAHGTDAYRGSGISPWGISDLRSPGSGGRDMKHARCLLNSRTPDYERTQLI